MQQPDPAGPQPWDVLPWPADAREHPRTPGQLAPRRLRASWLRSRRYEVSAERVQPRFVGQTSTDSLLFECGSQVLQGLAGAVANEPISMMVADADGLVLLRVCEDAAIVRALDRVHLAPGFSYNENAVGTNGLGLSLADRAPTLVRGDEHFCAELRGYTCAAVPVISPTGDLAGSINLTTWSDRSSDLLLALAQAAAGTTSAMMQVRAGGLAARPVERGEVYRVVGERLPGAGPDPCVSRAWLSAVDDIQQALTDGLLVAVVGESGAGKAAAAAFAMRTVRPGRHLVRAPFGEPQARADEWLVRWLPELASPSVCVLASGLDQLPAWAGDQLASTMAASGDPASLIISAEDLAGLPPSLVDRVGAVVEVPPLRRRPDDIVPLAHSFARRGQRGVELADDVTAAFRAHDWPGNVAELAHVVRRAATRTDRITLAHLPADVFSRAGAHLTRLERLERDEIVRCLTQGEVTMADAAKTLGLSRATLYRKIAHYGVELPRRS